MFKLFHSAPGPHGPVAEESADDSAAEIWGDQVDDDAVVVAGVEGDVGAPGFNDGADDVEGLIAVEGGDFDGDDVVDFGEAPPEFIAKHSAADGGLEIEADDRNYLRDFAGVGDELFFGGFFHGAEAEKAGVIAEFFQQAGF